MYAALSVISFIKGEYLTTLLDLCVAILFILSSIFYKKDKNRKIPEISTEDNLELKNLVFIGRKYKAMKRYRALTGDDLHSAQNYIEKLIEEN